MIGPFNNREVATAFWLVVLLALVLSRTGARESLAWGLRAFFHYKILAGISLMALYTAGVVRLLAAISLWNASLLKDTIVWFCASAMAMLIRFVTSKDDEHIFRKVLTENVTIVVVLEFLVNAYTFSLPAELVIVPLLALIVALGASAMSDKQSSDVAKVAKGTQAAIGFTILAIVVKRAVSDLRVLASFNTIRSIALAPLLSLLFVPCLYVLVLMARYDEAFARLDRGVKKDKRLKRYARHRILMHVGLRLRKINHILRDHSIDLANIQTEADVERLVDQTTDS